MQDELISRQAVEDKLLKLCNELEGIFADIRMKEVDDCVCGLCEYDCDHGIDGSAFECPGFETDECFKLADEIRHEWQSTKDLPPVKPQYTENEIQKMQDLEQAEIEKAYEFGKVEGQKSEDAISRQAVLDEISDYNNDLDYTTNELYDRVKRMSPVNPQPNTGHWIRVDKDKCKCDQ